MEKELRGVDKLVKRIMLASVVFVVVLTAAMVSAVVLGVRSCAEAGGPGEVAGELANDFEAAKDGE